MKVIKKKQLLLAFTILVITLLAIFYRGFIPKKIASAEGIDYVNQAYTDVPTGFDVATEDVVYKIHCANIRSNFPAEEEFGNYVTKISFRASSGCQIYFVDGIACRLEDMESGDYECNDYANYYEILHYDSTNKYVYLKFKNLSQLDADETVEGSVSDLTIIHRKATYLNTPQYIYLSEIKIPVTEITKDDVYFSSEVKAADGLTGWSGYSLYYLEYELTLNQKVAHLVSEIEISFLKGGEAFTLRKDMFTPSDGQGLNGYIRYSIFTLGDICSLTERVKLRAVVRYGEKSITAESSETDLITLWKGLVENNFTGSYISSTNQKQIQKIVKSYQSGFYEEIKGSQYYFTDYDKNTDIKLTSLIFKIPLLDFKSATFAWRTNYWQGYVYNVYLRIDSSGMLSAEAYKVKANEDGTVTVGDDPPIYNDGVAQELYDGIDYFVYERYLYVRIKNDMPITGYFPQNAVSMFSVTASDTNSVPLTIQANTATIIYDEYNQELLAELERLQAELDESQRLLGEASALVETQRETVSVLQSSLDGLRFDYQSAQTQMEYLNEQLQVMREEYQKKIDQLIAENNNQESVPKDENEEQEEGEGADDSINQIVGLCAGIVLFAVVLVIILPKRRW